MRVAAVDIGTNTVLLLVTEKNDAGELVAVEEHATITRLGEGVDKTRVLLPAAIARTNACLDRYAEIVAHAGVARVAVVGTSAMRDAEGGHAIGEHVKTRFGVAAQTISGSEEARLTFVGALSGLAATTRKGNVTVFDIGGGSTEVVHGDGATGAIAIAQSYDVGSVRLTERHIRSDPPSTESCEAIVRSARTAFAPEPRLGATQVPIGIAGTMTTLAAIALGMATYDGARVHGFKLTVGTLESVVDKLASVPLEKRKQIDGLDPKRADVIVAGGLVALAFLAQAGAREVIVSDRGVRWGLAQMLHDD